MRARIALLCLLSLTALPVLSQPVLYSTGHTGGSGGSTLYQIDPLTGVATAVGPIGFERCGASDFDATGVLYAACEDPDLAPPPPTTAGVGSDGGSPGVLVTIDLATGAGTAVGPTGISGAITDISFDAGGTLYAYNGDNDPEHSLYTLDTGTGMATLVGDTGLSAASGNAMGFDGIGTLFHSQVTGPPGQDLNSLDPGTGAASFEDSIADPVTPVNFLRYNSMDFDPATGLFWATLRDGSKGSGPSYVVTLDISIDGTSVTANLIGQTTNEVDGIAVALGGPVGPVAPEVPSLGGVGLVLLALLLAGGAVWVLRRRA